MVLVQATVHRLTVCTFDLQKHQKRGGFRNAPSTSEGSTLREPRARQGNGFPAHTLPSTDRQRTPSRCCASCPAYAPTTTSPARCRAGRAKQYNHARNVKPLPPSEESGAGSARSLVRPKRPALQGEVPRGEAIHISAPWSLGCARRLVWPIFLCCSLYLAPWRFPRLLSSPWPDLSAGARLLASFWQKKEESPFLYALLSESILWIAFALALS